MIPFLIGFVLFMVVNLLVTLALMRYGITKYTHDERFYK
jgi:hypothetical protein